MNLVPQQTVIVEIRDVYGKPMLYPANDQAARLAGVAGTKTLKVDHLRLARGLGLDVRELHGRPIPGLN